MVGKFGGPGRNILPVAETTFSDDGQARIREENAAVGLRFGREYGFGMRKLLWFIAAATAGVLLSVALARLHRAAENEQPPAVAVDSGPADKGSDWDIIRHWLDRPVDGGHPTVRFRVVRPGVILPRGAAARPHLPPDVTVVITRRGDDPAQIRVRRGSETWEVSEGELDKLPADVRPYVDGLLGPLWRPPADGQKGVDLVPSWPGAAAGPNDCPLESRLQQQLEDMSRQMEQLRQRVDGLRAGGP